MPPIGICLIDARAHTQIFDPLSLRSRFLFQNHFPNAAFEPGVSAQIANKITFSLSCNETGLLPDQTRFCKKEVSRVCNNQRVATESQPWWLQTALFSQVSYYVLNQQQLLQCCCCAIITDEWFYSVYCTSTINCIISVRYEEIEGSNSKVSIIIRIFFVFIKVALRSHCAAPFR